MNNSFDPGDDSSQPTNSDTSQRRLDVGPSGAPPAGGAASGGYRGAGNPGGGRSPSGNGAAQKGILGALGSLGVLLLKFKSVFAVLKFAYLAKYLITAGSMLVSIVLEAMIFGWPMAVGIVMMIFIHECGHAWAARRLGQPYSGMIFIPFMGAAVFHKRGGKSATEDAFVGIMGPVVGTAAGVVALLIGLATHNRFWVVLSELTFFINLFNLLPTPPLDGGWITPVFSPKLLAVGVVLLFLIGFRNPFIWLLLLASIPRIIAGWKAGPGDAYFQTSRQDRVKYAAAYLGLAAFLALSNAATRWILAG